MNNLKSYSSGGISIGMRREFFKIGKQAMMIINDEDLKDG